MTPVQPADRTVVVLGAGSGQGSGVLLTGRLVLTCAHVVGPGRNCSVAHPDLAGYTEAAVVWIDHVLDAAVIETAAPLLPVEPVRLGVLHGSRALPGCEITGFPDVQRYGPDEHLEADQYTATALPLAGRVRDLLVCELDGPPAGAGQALPALRGLSGGPVFAGNVLIGIARQIPPRREGRRVECVPLGPLVTSASLRLVYRDSGTELRHERVHGHFPNDLRHEEEHAAALGAAYRRTKIFGLDELGRHDSEWDLDTAYLSLEAQPPGDPHKRGERRPEPRRIDALLADRPRVLLRGDAGAGKTTLVWWLAAHASAGTLGPRLAALNGLVPFVVPLRTLRARGGAFPSVGQLAAAAGTAVDDPPEGWAGRVLESGRGLLLVDGLDEVTPDDREAAYEWLSRLLHRYPATRCVATVRPHAVGPGWLESEDFEELRLLPMRDEDIAAFVAAWHRAARLDDPDDATLTELERDLIRQFSRNSTLSNLARTPLLCAVICALHRRRQGLLPETRWSLYDSALSMLLGNRDRRRRIEAPEGITMNVDEQAQLLQRIAIWLVRGGQSELGNDQALHQLEQALRGMEQVRRQGSAAEILTHLLNRSGVLQERADGIYQFAHRTFQDFLAAKEFVEGGHLHELIGRADAPQWQDVILLAAGHCGRREHPLLINGLLDTESGPDSFVTRTELHVLAALCAQHATWLDDTTRARASEAVAALFPPGSARVARLLAQLGPAVLRQLPDPADPGLTDDQIHGIAELIHEVGGAEAVPHARRWVLAHPQLGMSFRDSWDRYPADPYAEQVLAVMELKHRRLSVDSADQLAALRHLPSVTDLRITGKLSSAELRAGLRGRPWVSLFVREDSALTDLAFLADCAATLTDLSLLDCPEVEDLGPLGALPELSGLQLDMSHLPPSALRATAGSGRLSFLDLIGLRAHRLGEVPAHPQVSALTLSGEHPMTIDALRGWDRLQHLELRSATAVPPMCLALRESPQVTSLTVRAGAAEFQGAAVVPSVTTLTLTPFGELGGLGPLPRVFPGLKTLRLSPHPSGAAVDLTPLEVLPGLVVDVTGFSAVTGGKGLRRTPLSA
ncbi:serine protease [Streptomyces sp. RKAG290]|uniref:NACHT domain-containing protein n=1 Tax=Streptomyces sp. RKAG290 TaxID=2888348 RepID=UPI002033EA19|nr:serine protease [Streptomyces sp. RKAG290]MCM2413385.1 NACHT domain-containing protein [Streptomyces sp. RKAG290]